MTSPSLRTQFALFVALVVPAAIALWLMVGPTAMSFSTYVALTLLAIGVATVTLNSARNARPTGSLGQLLYDIEHPGVGGTARTVRKDPRGNPW